MAGRRSVHVTSLSFPGSRRTDARRIKQWSAGDFAGICDFQAVGYPWGGLPTARSLYRATATGGDRLLGRARWRPFADDAVAGRGLAEASGGYPALLRPINGHEPTHDRGVSRSRAGKHHG